MDLKVIPQFKFILFFTYILQLIFKFFFQEFEKIKDIIPASEELDFKKKPYHKNFGHYVNYIKNFD